MATGRERPRRAAPAMRRRNSTRPASRRGRASPGRGGPLHLVADRRDNVIVSAVGDEIVIQHPGEVLHGPELTALVAGPIIYLAGHVLFRLRMAGTLSHSRPVAMLAILACAPVGLVAPALVVASMIAAVLVLLVAWETLRGAPLPARVAHAGAGALD